MPSRRTLCVETATHSTARPRCGGGGWRVIFRNAIEPCWVVNIPILFGCIYNIGMGQNPIPLVNIKIAGKWMFIPLKMVCIGIDP